MLTLYYHLIWETQGFSFYVLGSGQDCMPTACSDLRGPTGVCDTRFWRLCDDDWTVDSTTSCGCKDHEPRKLCSCSDSSLPCPSLTSWIATNVEYGRLDLSSLRTQNKRHGVSLLGSAANAQHCMHVGLGQPAEVPTQTIERVEKALMTLQSIERFACDLHDQVSFAKAWMLMSKESRACPGL